MTMQHRIPPTYVSLAFVMFALGIGAQGQPGAKDSTMEDSGYQEDVIFDFDPATEPWPNIDDPVMGGLSQSRMRIDGDVAVFEGVVSLENNGGFASLRSRPAEHGLAGSEGIVLRVRGDGKTYGVRLRTDRARDGVNYQAPLMTEAGRWAEVRLPFSAFTPVFRGRDVRGYPALDPTAIRTFGLIIADRQDGLFRLEIDWIKDYRKQPDPGARHGTASR